MTDDELLRCFSDVRFLRTETLNHDLCGLLEEVDIPDKLIESVRDSARVLPDRGGRGKEESWRKYFSDEDVQACQRSPLLSSVPGNAT